MKLDLSKLKLHPRDTEVFFEQARGDDVFLADLGGKFIDPVEVEIVVDNTGTIYAGRGRVRTLVQLPCARCLQDFTYPIETEFQAAIVESSRSDQFSPDEGFIFIDEEMADIGPLVEEAIFMAIPICPVCQPECQGLCPVCGQDKNTATCSCHEDTIDPRWEKLKSLV
jgi:uncharacterized protein